MSTYRDDLEAAQQRAGDLERELTELRARYQALEERLAGVRDTADALANAKRLEGALERELQEHRDRFNAEVDERVALKLADWTPPPRKASVPQIAAGMTGVFGLIVFGELILLHTYPAAVVTLFLTTTIVALINAFGGASGGR